MNQATRNIWNGTAQSLPLKERLRAAAIAGDQGRSVTPSVYNRWLGASTCLKDSRCQIRRRSPGRTSPTP